jgi:hypothetical protein
MQTFRQIRHRMSKTRLRAPLMWLRHRSLGPADVLVASYPRSGSTWLRFLLVEILTGRPSEFPDVNQLVPKIGRQDKALPLLPGGGRLIQTHEPYRDEYRKAVYLVRDPRDVVISEFAYQKALGLIGDGFDEFLELFVLGKANGYGSWCHHVQAWLEASEAKDADILMIRFEDMRRNPISVVASTLQFLGISVDQERVESAVRGNSVERMRDKEDRTPQIGASSGEENRFVRRGVVGGWRSKLTPSQLELLHRYVASMLSRLGYASSGSVEELIDQPSDIAFRRLPLSHR